MQPVALCPELFNADQPCHLIAAFDHDMPVLLGVGIDGRGVYGGIPFPQKRDEPGEQVERVGRCSVIMGFTHGFLALARQGPINR
jgi:hypothetical protein